LPKRHNPASTIEALSVLLSTVQEDAAGGGGAKFPLWALVGIELILGSLMLCGWRPRVTLVASTFLLACFSGWVGYLWISGAKTACGCGHVGVPLLQASTRSGEFARTFGLFFASVIGLVARITSNQQRFVFSFLRRNSKGRS